MSNNFRRLAVRKNIFTSFHRLLEAVEWHLVTHSLVHSLTHSARLPRLVKVLQYTLTCYTLITTETNEQHQNFNLFHFQYDWIWPVNMTGKTIGWPVDSLHGEKSDTTWLPGRGAGVKVNLLLDFKRVANVVSKKTVTVDLYKLCFILPFCFNRWM